MRQHANPYDFIFAGMGAGASLLLLSMEKRGLLAGRRVAVFEPSEKQANDKTFCFWSCSDEPVSDDLVPLISHAWEWTRVDGKDPECIAPMAYRHVRSIDLYRAARQVMEKHNFAFLREAALETGADDTAAFLRAHSGEYRGAWVFDSRPPKFLPPKSNEAHLLQSFTGYYVRTASPTFDKKTFEIMNFEVDQGGATQFVYTLPFSDQEALIELTRFGERTLEPDYAAKMLDAFIRQNCGPYERIGVETGCIPMSSASLQTGEHPRVVALGTRGGQVKPSTGYAFKNMYAHAEAIAASLQRESAPANSFPKRKARFALYDRLLLQILSRSPALGKPIFQQLFRARSAAQVLRFLDEKTSLREDAAIFARLPWTPFLSALALDLRAQALARPLLLLLFAIALWGLQFWNPAAANILGYSALILGLILVGIPHGAVDHLLESGQIQAPIRPRFAIEYLALGAALAPLWFWFPDLALAVFLAYSAWHFGQADMREWNISSPLKSMLWGAALLGAILLSHTGELNPILEQLGAQTWSVAGETAAVILFLSALWALWEARPGFLLSVALLALGTQLPLLIAFGLYFVGQHSLNGWSHIKTRLQASDASLFAKALPFHAGAWLLMGLFFLYYRKMGADMDLSAAAAQFFIFLSCLSFPHVLAMHQFYRRIDKQ
jgi:lycopene beta-cyclase